MCHLATDEQIVWKVIRIPPERSSPELAVSVYPSYGPLIDAIFVRDAPLAVSQGCVDDCPFILRKLLAQCFAGNAQTARRFAFVAATGGKRLQDASFFDFFERQIA